MPDWVGARSPAVLMLVFQGSFATGSATWGAVAAPYGPGRALLFAGIGVILAAALEIYLRLSDASVDVTPWNHWRMPVLASDAERSGPVLVLVRVEYQVHPPPNSAIHSGNASMRTPETPGWCFAMGCVPRLREGRSLPRNIRREFLGGARTPAWAGHRCRS